MLIGEIGDINRFDSYEQIRKYAGLNLVENSSGKILQIIYAIVTKNEGW